MIIKSFTLKQPQDLSAEPWAFLDSFPHLSPATHYLSTGWVVPLASFSQPCSQYLLPGWEFLDIFQPRLSVSTMSGYASDVSTADPSVSSYWKGTGKLLSHQIKLRIFTNRGDSRNRRELLKFVCTPWGGRWTQGATAGTKAPVPQGIQSKKRTLQRRRRWQRVGWLDGINKSWTRSGSWWWTRRSPRARHPAGWSQVEVMEFQLSYFKSWKMML